MELINRNTITIPLKRGDDFIAINVSSASNNDDRINKGIKILEGWGLNCKEIPKNNHFWGYLAGTDEDRYKSLYPIKPPPLTIFTRGGWGSARLLEFPVKWKGGWLLGYSDVTSILMARLAAGFDGCVHGPMLTSLSEEPEWSLERLHAILFGESIPDIKGQSWSKGISQGAIITANLTIATHLIGTKFMPKLKGTILIFEDINEEPYRIDRMLTQWRLSGLLNSINGLAFGKFKDCNPYKEIPKDKKFQLNEVLKERTKDLGIPIIHDLPIGHCCGNAAIPLGKKVEIDGSKGVIRFLRD